MRGMQCNVDFWYQLSICSKDRGKPRKKPRERKRKSIIYEARLPRKKFVEIIFKNSVRTSKRTPHFTISKIIWLMLFKEIIAGSSTNDTEPMNALWTKSSY
jgi:hypothetical protein